MKYLSYDVLYFYFEGLCWFCQPFSLLGMEAPDWLNKECSDWLNMMVRLDWLDMGCLDYMEKEQFDWLTEV